MIRQLMSDRQNSTTNIAKQFRVSWVTVYRVVQDAKKREIKIKHLLKTHFKYKIPVFLSQYKIILYVFILRHFFLPH